MLLRQSNPTFAGLFVTALFGAIVLVGCGGGDRRATDLPSELPTNLASVEVTYYYLPG
jgi:hypothetical protein